MRSRDIEIYIGYIYYCNEPASIITVVARRMSVGWDRS